MKLVLITGEENSEREISLLNEMLEKFDFNLHVRKPKFSEMELDHWINKMVTVYHKRMIVHGSSGFAIKAGIGGVHKKGNDDWASGKYTSASCHSFSEVLKANDKVDYSFLSPVKDSISKKGYESNFSTKDLKQFFDKNDVTVYALGGIQPSNIQEMKSLGFAGVALMGAIWNAEDPISELEKALKQCQA